MDDLSFIVLKVKISRRKHIFVVNIYRQWHLPITLQTSPDKVGLPAQLDRFSRITRSIKSIDNGVTPIIVQGDLNIDQWTPNDPLNRYDICQLQPVLEDLKTEVHLEQMNFKPTRFRNHQNPSLLDLVLTNKPQHINCVETTNSNIADHLCVACQFHIKELEINQQFICTRNLNLLNSEKLMNSIEDNEKLTEVFKYTDPDKIADVVINEMNSIVEDIAPSKIVQRRAKDEISGCDQRNESRI